MKSTPNPGLAARNLALAILPKVLEDEKAAKDKAAHDAATPESLKKPRK